MRWSPGRPRRPRPGGGDAGAAVARSAFLAATAAGTSSAAQAHAVIRGLADLDPASRTGFQVVAAWEVGERAP